MSDGYVIYVCDTETTGLDPVENDVIEISACRLTFDSEGKPTTEQKTWLLKALNPKSIQDEALAINGHKREDICHMSKYGKENYKLPADVASDFELWIMEDGVSSMDRIFAGQNPNFDIQALQELWKKVGSPGTFPFSLENGNRVIDTKQIATLWDLCVGKRRLYYNLSSLVKAFGVKKGKAHKADEDVRMTTDLLIKLLEPVRALVATTFKDCYPDEDP
ncbi:MAG TPA: 3'-5' exonuclease [Anaerovoracaceae bacterium]|nr:3'-5' exonuclease [Anaerovoracaceae bacterium]